MVLVGVVGSYLHIRDNLTAMSTIVRERFVRGAPFLAPLLFANMGTLGLLALLPPGGTAREWLASGRSAISDQLSVISNQ